MGVGSSVDVVVKETIAVAIVVTVGFFVELDVGVAMSVTVALAVDSRVGAAAGSTAMITLSLLVAPLVRLVTTNSNVNVVEKLGVTKNGDTVSNPVQDDHRPSRLCPLVAQICADRIHRLAAVERHGGAVARRDIRAGIGNNGTR